MLEFTCLKHNITQGPGSRTSKTNTPRLEEVNQEKNYLTEGRREIRHHVQDEQLL